ncbi:MAG: EAL domain-containing protein [Methylococcaceae bacterium]|nr:EAL domain-containing protein [Methylococcaceae bacterium]
MMQKFYPEEPLFFKQQDNSTNGTDLDSLACLANESRSGLSQQDSVLLVNTNTVEVANVKDTIRSAHISNPITAGYKNYCLHSAFQPIFSIAHRRPVGYEGLIRVQTAEQQSRSPLELFSEPETNGEYLALDRICRRLHVQNFSQQRTNNEWLFINLNSQCLATEKPSPGYMSNLLSISGIEPQRIVIEILEGEISDRVYLKELIARFRSIGCLIAIDDFGAGHSNFDRIWELEPDIVKIDRSLIQRAALSSRIERMLISMVSLIHEAGSLVIIEGVETEKEALTAMKANTDMVQGFYFAKPNAHISEDGNLDKTFSHLLQLQKCQKKSPIRDEHYDFTQFEKLFKTVADEFTQSQSLEGCAQRIFTEQKAVRYFLLDEAGYQIGANINSPAYHQKSDGRFAPLLSGDKANWAHKHYHYRAIQHLNKIQISRPYLSTTDAQMCITVSQAIEVNNKIFVLCCDLGWQDN